MISLYDTPNPLVLSAAAGPTAPAASATGSTGKLLGIWRLGELLHQGTHSQLWSAQPADCLGSTRWEYVVKAIPRELSPAAQREQSLVRLHRFVDAATAAQHPHLVSTCDSALGGAEPFVVMPRLSGRSLAELVANGAAQSLPVVLWLVRQAAAACTALHQTGRVHGEVEPHNVLVSPQGQATLLDLGGSRRISPTDPQAASAADVAALGRLLWQLLALVDKDQTGTASIAAAADLITELVHPEPENRPAADQLTARLLQLETAALGQHIRPAKQRAARQAA
jgi:eukaryotic-like serine/threonine-protein kinase